MKLKNYFTGFIFLGPFLLFYYVGSAQIKIQSTENHTFSKKSKSCEKKGFLCFTFTSEWETIKINNSKVEKLINSFITESVKEDTQIMITEQMREYDNLTQEDMDNMYDFEEEDTEYSSMFLQFSTQIKYKVNFVTHRTTCIKSTYTEIEGGLEPISNTNYVVLDNTTGDALFLADLVSDTSEMKKMAISALKKKWSYEDVNSENKTLENFGFLINEVDFYLSDNIELNEKGLVFHYLPLEIAKSEMGEINIPFTKEEILPYLKFNPWE
jgi:hypothetical protein